MALDRAEEAAVFLSNLPAGTNERRFALAVVLASTLLFLAFAPFAKVQLPVLPPFIALYEAALVINDLITAVFLFGQFHISRSKALLLLACGYMFTALIAVAHALSFPGLFAPNGLLGAGPQSTAWLYMFWHAGFPLLVIAYALSRDDARAPARPHHSVILTSLAVVLAVVCVLTLIATSAVDALPSIMHGSRYSSAMIMTVSGVWLLSLVALLVLSRRGPESVLDLWLTVVMCAWLFDIALSAVLNAGRYDLGFYCGRIYGLIANSLVLAVLLIENSRLYARLIEARRSDRRKADELHRLSTIDPLTGIANRRAFEEALDQEWRRTMRHTTPLSLLMIDVDFFKRYNDAYGHVGGDECLQRVAQALAGKTRRAGEMAARYGGEEFAVLLPHSDLDEAHRLGELICEAVRQLRIPHKGSEAAPHVTISIGIANSRMLPAADRETAAARESAGRATALIEAADRALYQAKQAGRNRAVSTRADAHPKAEPISPMAPAFAGATNGR
jgi:diguanylate cyclase (GGDEF)-like protein